MSRWSNEQLAQALADNPDLHLSPQNPPLELGSHQTRQKQKKSVLASVGLKEQGKKRKYRNEPTVVNGIRFDSKKEARRFSELQLLEKAGEVKNLIRQPKYEFWHNKIRIGSYRPDFVYQENGETVIEDCKSTASKTTAYQLRKRMMLAFYAITIRET